MNYLNIRRDLSYEMSNDMKFCKKELINKVLKEFEKGKMNILCFKELESSQIQITIKIDGIEYQFITLLKNITGAGWKEKPKIKRVQVSNIKKSLLINCNQNAFNLIMGYYNFDDNPIIVCWDAYRYLNHNTIRSCYVSLDSLKVGYMRGFYEGVDSSQKLWVFKGEHFYEFFRSYIDYNIKMKR